MTISHAKAQALMDSLREVMWQGAAARRRMEEPIPGIPHHIVSFLVVIHRADGIRQGDLAEALQIDASVASRHVAVLLEQQLITRDVDPRDRRAYMLRVTDVGVEALAALRERQTHWLRDVLADWDDTRASAAATALAELAERMTEAAHALPRATSTTEGPAE